MRPYRNFALVILLASMLVCALVYLRNSRQSTAHDWTGRWTGVEGTYLDIARSEAGYAVTIKDLDAARTFAATAERRGLSFERDGARESIRATDGAGTGMKWLAQKSRCLVIRPGEGYCRD